MGFHGRRVGFVAAFKDVPIHEASCVCLDACHRQCNLESVSGFLDMVTGRPFILFPNAGFGMLTGGSDDGDTAFG